MLRFFRTTLLGGVLFLVPVVIFIVFVGKALQITNKLALPIAAILGFDAVAGVMAAEIIAIGILVIGCFLAGLVAKTNRARKFVRSLETNVLEKIPAYELLRAKTTSVLNAEDAEQMHTVLAKFDDSWQLAFEIERLKNGNVFIYLPGSPDPWSGSVCILTKDRITPLDLTVNSTVRLLKRLGKGSAEVLPGGQKSGSVASQPVT